MDSTPADTTAAVGFPRSEKASRLTQGKVAAWNKEVRKKQDIQQAPFSRTAKSLRVNILNIIMYTDPCGVNVLNIMYTDPD